jgi:hypothetical protein
MDIQETVLIDFEDRVTKRRPAAIRGTRTAGSYASRVEIASPQGSTFDGLRGVVVHVTSETAFVRLRLGADEVTLPFGTSELTVL